MTSVSIRWDSTLCDLLDVLDLLVPVVPDSFHPYFHWSKRAHGKSTSLYKFHQSKQTLTTKLLSTQHWQKWTPQGLLAEASNAIQQITSLALCMQKTFSFLLSPAHIVHVWLQVDPSPPAFSIFEWWTCFISRLSIKLADLNGVNRPFC